MDPEAYLADFFAGGDRAFVPHVSVDCSILGFHEGELKILLLKWKHLDAWSLPGGFVRRGEELDRAAARVLRERAGVDRIYLRQFHTFGGPDRHEEALAPVFAGMGVRVPAGHWVLDRIVAVGYLALVDFEKVTPAPDFLSEDCRWWDIREHPPLLFDHDEMVARALHTLRTELSYLPLGLELLPEKFTMPELQRLYETVLGRALDRRNFQKRMLDLGFVERLPERRTGAAHRAPYLYRFRGAAEGRVPGG
jgi:ADP-ribose pyrophosphatase YjhB (NUDIX family)